MAIDFDKLSGEDPSADLTDPLQLFTSLDRKSSHTHLRMAQIDALKQLHARRKERDLILKMPTGTGKSSVGLLYIRSVMAEKKRPGVYLCPTVQLVDQTLQEAEKLGIRAFPYRGGEPQPNAKCVASEAVIVCTYDKLFTGKTTFNRLDVNITPSVVVLDDAHTGVEEVRDNFTISVRDGSLRAELLKVLAPVCKRHSRALWDDIESARPHSILELPYWSWSDLHEEVRKILSTHDAIALPFAHLQDILRWCRCLISCASIEILPDIMPTSRVRPFAAAGQRVYMSATLADDSVLVRELGCSPEAALKPIVTGSESDVGERMVLVPHLLHRRLDRDWLLKWCKSMTKHRIVVICPSTAAAHFWTTSGAQVAIDDAVPKAVADLRSGKANFVAFAQRYDGVDLPDDACRILIIDGMPYGEGLADRYDSQRIGSIGGTRNRTIYRIEQGMGRAVRSPADFAVVILAGPELATFTANRDVLERMTPETRAQIELAMILADQAEQTGEAPEATFKDLVGKCLQRDAGWKKYYDKKVRQAMRTAPKATPAQAIALAATERQAAELALLGDTSKAVAALSKVLDEHKPTESEQALYLQAQASYLYETDPGKAIEVQHVAYTRNNRLLRPPKGVVRRPGKADLLEAPARVLRHYETFTGPNGLIADFDRIRTMLAFGADFELFEQGLLELSCLIGTNGSRPEKEEGEGPDDLWLWPDLCWVIEAKNMAGYDAIPKKDAEQLLHSKQWFEDNYKARAKAMVPVMVAPTTKTERGVHLPEGTRIIIPEKLEDLLKNVEYFVLALKEKPRSAWDEKAVGALLVRFGLAASQMSKYTIAS